MATAVRSLELVSSWRTLLLSSARRQPGNCHEARLLWEEGVKMPATAMSTSSFRHGPQEIVRQGMRFCLWIDQVHMRDQDLAVAQDLRELGASVMLIGER